jgi:hypothetical protein
MEHAIHFLTFWQFVRAWMIIKLNFELIFNVFKVQTPTQVFKKKVIYRLAYKVIWNFFLLKIAPWLQKCAYFVSMEVNPNRYRSSKETNWEILKISWIFTFFGLVVKIDLLAYKPCTMQFSIFKADAQVEDLKILKSCIPKVCCDKHMQLLRPQGFWISQKMEITPP